ncbi:MAG: glycosyltransferase [Saprospiraceae bacterium]|nr:glycosyltransferase [Saprospiraceae bacterium]
MEYWEKLIFNSLSPTEFFFVSLWVVLFLVYALILFRALKTAGYTSQSDIQTTKQTSAKISILIPARNEEEHLKKCLEAILNQHDIHLIEEVLVLNDHSTDNTKKIVENLQNPLIRCLSLPDSITGKKAAITYGVKQSKASVIALTDADCIPEKNWIKTISNQYTNSSTLIFTTGPVCIQNPKNVLERFQSLDFMANMAMTAWGIRHKLFYLANGANMSFRKTSFDEVGGYEGNNHIASGDDVFLVKIMAGLKNKTVMFLNDSHAVVATTPQKTWSELWEQRKRWATKSKVYASGILWSFQALVFILAAGIMVFLLYSMIFKNPVIQISLYLLISKAVVDYCFLSGLSKKWNLRCALTYFPLSFITYQIYIIMMGLMALFPSSYSWKGRKQQ